MICHLCQKDKLSKEFPVCPLTEHCDHPILHCLRCVVASVKNSHKCSQCDNEVQEDNKQYKQCIAKLNFLFPKIDSGDFCLYNNPSSVPSDASSHIMVTTLSGECTTLAYNPKQTIQQLKTILEKDLETPSNKQRLLYQDTELKTKNQNNELLRLEDYNIPPNSTLYLLVLLYAVPEGLDKVIFDLFWGYPETLKKDALDASVLLYSGSEFIDVINYKRKKSNSCSAVKHSGDVMDDVNRLGHHTIDVSIKSIPSYINKLVFTLSAWDSPNISKYPNPSLRFFDAKFPNEQLCSDEMSHAAQSQAIIMCCLSKIGEQWHVFSLKNLSAGNAMDYAPLKETIVGLINQGYI